MKIRSVLVFLVLALSIGGGAPSARASDAQAAVTKGQWKVIHQEEGLNILEKEDEGSDLVTFKGDGYLDASLVKVAGVLLNHERTPEWVDSLEEDRVLKFISPDEFIEYTHIGTPIIVKDRDFVVKTKLEYESDIGRLTVRSKSVADPVMPPTKYVRGEVQLMEFTLQATDGGKRTHLSAELRVDPKGSIPKWLVNLFQRSWPRKAFYGIRKELSRPEYRFPDPFRKVFALNDGEKL